MPKHHQRHAGAGQGDGENPINQGMLAEVGRKTISWISVNPSTINGLDMVAQ